MTKKVIVAGGAGALGGAVAEELRRRDWQTAVVDMAGSPAGGGHDMFIGSVDLSDEAAVQRAYAGIATEWGAIDALVNVVGGFLWAPVAAGSADDWDRMYRMNLRTAAVSSHAALSLLRDGTSAIVNVGAAGAASPGLGMAAYAASKAGVQALTQSLAEELRPRGIRVNAVLPTIIDTPANRRDMPDADTATWVKPEAVANVIAFLISKDAAAISGAAIPLSVGG